MDHLVKIQNLFTKDTYPPNEKNISEVPYEDIQSFLVQEFGETGFEIKVTHVGNNTQAYVVVSLTISTGKGTITVPGAAEGPIGIPGLITSAIRNAVLRHLGTGAELYQHEVGQEPQFDNSSNVPQSPFAGSTTYGNTYQGQAQGGNSYQRQGNFGGKPGGAQGYGPWTGEVKIKSGNFAGLKWNQVPDNDIQRMAGSGNNLAQKEAGRRGF